MKSLRKEIKEIVKSAFEIVVESCVADNFRFEGIDISNTDVSKFIDNIPRKTIEKWHKKLAKKTEKDFLVNSSSYKFDEGFLTWKDIEVHDWHRDWYSERIITLYKKSW